MPSSKWPSQMVSAPRSGKPNQRCIDTNINSSDNPMITSGITKGALTMPLNKVRPLKRPNLTSENAANMPKTTDPQAVKNAIFSDNHSPEIISRSFASVRYHLVVKPPHWVGSGESLNEYTINAMIGR